MVMMMAMGEMVGQIEREIGWPVDDGGGREFIREVIVGPKGYTLYLFKF